MATNYLAVDLGAESGRVMAGTLDRGVLSLQEVHRFANLPVREEGSLHWNVSNLILEIKEGLRKAPGTALRFESISTDAWGVDYMLFNGAGEVLSPTFHYRDGRTKRGVEAALGRISWERIFGETGIQFMPINTIFQLASESPERLGEAEFLLGIGDGVNFFLSGTRKMEVSMASTFQLWNPRTAGWSDELISAVGVPRHLFPEVVPSGTRLGPMRTELAYETGLPKLEVIATCSHDTGAAVAAVPAAGEGREDWAYLSSGTWSLMGVELEAPVITDAAREKNFTNEVGYGNTIRFLKNLSGLWLVQECRRIWAEEGRELDYGTLTRMASVAAPFASLINPMAEEFLAPENMPRAIADFCKRTGQEVPPDEGGYVRCALESLALLYGRTLRELEEVTKRRIEVLHVVGGGSQNHVLNQFTADAVGRRVVAGPVEATAAGNVLIQAITLGRIRSLSEGRAIMRRSQQVREYYPHNAEKWGAAAKRFEGLLEQP